MTKTLSSQINPVLDEYKKANSKGNHVVANTCLIKMIEMLVEHIDTQSVTLTPIQGVTWANPAPHAADHGNVWDNSQLIFTKGPVTKEDWELIKSHNDSISPSWNDFCKGDSNYAIVPGTEVSVSPVPTGKVSSHTTRKKPGRKPGQKLIKPLDTTTSQKG